MNTSCRNRLSEMSGARHVSSSAAGLSRRARHVALAATLSLCATLLPATIAYADDHGDDHGRPIGGSCETTFAFTGPTTVDIAGTCHLRHLGLSTVVASQTATPLDNGTLFLTQTGAYTAANGDQLYTNVIAIAVFTSPTSVSFSGTETYRGGTGRFVDALGSAALAGSAHFTSASAGVGEYAVLGTISF